MNDLAYRLRDEIALLQAVKDANDACLTAYSEPHRSCMEVRAEGRWIDATRAGISEWDADHPCRAIDEREAELRRQCPDVALREMGVAPLPGFDL